MEIHEKIDALSGIIEDARAVPLSNSCVVPRDDALDLVDDIRAALPDAVKEADEVLLEREDIIEEAQAEATETLASAKSDSSLMMSNAQQDAENMIEDARSNAERMIEDAREDAEAMLERARNESRRMIDEQEVMIQAQSEAAGLIEDAQARAQAIVEQATREAEDISYSTRQELDELVEQTRAETSRERLQTDEFVDGKLAEIEEALGTSLAAVRRGRDRVHARRTAYEPVDLRTSSDANADMYDILTD